MKLRIGREDGMALMLALCVMFTLSIVTVTAITFTSSTTRHANRSKSDQQAYALAEAGLNNALSQVASHYPGSTQYGTSWVSGSTPVGYTGGTTTWTGAFSTSTGKWTLTGTGTIKNPDTGVSRSKTLTTTIAVNTGPTTVSTPDIWKYVYSGGTGATCDMTLDQQVTFAAPLYVVGNLCLEQGGTILQPTTYVGVGGTVDIRSTSGSIGTAAAKIPKVEVGTGCHLKNQSWYTPCTAPPVNTATTKIYATTFSQTLTPLTVPTLDWNAIYQSASPGPKNPCTTSSGTPPTFDNDSVIDNDGDLYNASTPYGGGSVSGMQNLTPGSNYTCKTSTGELSWNNTTKVLTVSGNIYIDGAATIDAGNGSVVRYSGFGNIFTSGGFSIKNNTTVCARKNTAGTDCDWNDWQPGVDRNGDGVLADGVDDPILLIHAYGKGWYSPMSSDESVRIDSAKFQGGLYGRLKIDVQQSSTVQGPLVSPTEVAPGQSTVQKFPTSLLVASGALGTTTTNQYTLGTPQDFH